MSQLETTDSIDTLFNEAIGYHNEGQIDKAISIYSQILDTNFQHSDSLHLLGVANHQLGESEKGVELIRQAISLNPDDAGYFSNLGSALKAVGRLVESIEAYEAAIDLDKLFLPAYYNVGEVYCLMDRVHDGEAAYRKALELNQNLPDIWTNLGICLLNQDKEQEAEECFIKALERMPTFPTALYSFARLRDRQERLDEANTLYAQALSMGFDQAACLRGLAMIAQRQSLPELAIDYLNQLIDNGLADADVYNNLSLAFKATGDLDKARKAIENALEIDSDHVESLCNLSSMLNEEGLFAEALPFAQKAVKLDENCDIAYNNAGSSYRGMAKLDEAAEAYDQALRINPEQPEYYNNLALVLEFQCRFDEMMEAFETAIDLKPDYAIGKANFAAALLKQGHLSRAKELIDSIAEKEEVSTSILVSLGRYNYELGRFPESLKAYQEALEINPKEMIALFGMAATQIARDDVEDEFLFKLHCEAASRIEDGVEPLSHDRIERSSTKIKLGFVSPDFKNHSVAFFLEPLIENLDRDRFEIHCYSSVPNPDEMTRRFQSLADEWHEISDTSGKNLASDIKKDGIDVLFDLAGYTAGSQIAAFVYKPAPIQVSYLGYAHSTGLSSMDFRIVDPVTDPEEKTFNSERLAEMPDCFLCYRPVDEAPEVGPLPALENESITFGCFNNIAKFTPLSARLFAGAMKAVPDSRILLKSHQADDPAVRERVTALFGNNDIDESRIEFMPRLPNIREHLSFYNRVDIALDTSPYNGTTTTCEAFWMGVPVVTLAGSRHASRVGASLNSVVGLSDLTAESEEDFIKKTAMLSENLEKLSEIRQELRQRVTDSPLRDESSFARNMESTILGMLDQQVSS